MGLKSLFYTAFSFALLLLLSLVCFYVLIKNSKNIKFIQELAPTSKELKAQECRQICVSDGCIRTSGNLLDTMKDMKPCDDFYSFACGNYYDIKYPKFGKLRSVVTSEAHGKLLIDIKNILETNDYENSEPGSQTLLKIKKVFNRCLNRMTSEGMARNGLSKIFDKVGLNGWPYLSRNWTLENTELDEFLNRFKTMGEFGFLSFSYTSYYTEEEDEALQNNTQNSMLESVDMKIYLENLLLPKHYYSNESPKILNRIVEYKAMIKGILKLLGISNTEREIMTEEILQLETSLANIPDKSENSLQKDEMENEEFYYNCSEQAVTKKSKWCNFIRHYIKFFGFDVSLIKIRFDEPIKAENLKDYIDNASKRTLANYLGIRMILKHIPELNEIFNQLVATNMVYKSNLRFFANPFHTVRYAFCTEWVVQRFQFPLTIEYVAKVFNRTTFEELEVIFNKVKNSSLLMLDTIPWIDKGYKNCIDSKISVTELFSWAFSHFFTADDMDEIFKDLQFNGETFIENSVEYNTFLEGYDTRCFTTENFYFYFPASFIFFSEMLKSNFRYTNKKVEAFLGELRFPTFSIHRPFFLNIGKVGVIIAHELGHGFMLAVESCRIMSNTSRLLYQDKSSCLIDQYSRFKIDSTDKFIKGKRTFGENFADNFAIHVTYDTFMKHVKQSGMENLPGLYVNPEQLFYILFSQLWCESETEKFYKIFDDVFHCPGKYRVLGPVLNAKTFVKSFNCPKGSSMNPEQKCEFFT